MTSSHTVRIRELNDEFRRMGPALGWHKFKGLWLCTAGVQTMSATFPSQTVGLVQNFDAFTKDNDPYGEHDFGSFELDGHSVFWKIDYLERGTPNGAEDPSDNARTCRMLTIMLADEY
jgi:hypothetical protein